MNWSVPLDRANDIYNLAMGGLIIGSLITIIAVIALIWASGVRNYYNNQNFAKVLALSDQAKAEAAKANERAAEFFVKAQQIALDQEKAQLEIEQVRTWSARRRVSAEQAARIAKALEGHSLTVDLLSPRDDPEAAQFAEDIAEALTNAGVKVTASKSFLSIPVRGLAMSLTASDSGTAIYMAFRSAGFEMKDLPERDPIMIIVGSKAPASPS